MEKLIEYLHLTSFFRYDLNFGRLDAGYLLYQNYILDYLLSFHMLDMIYQIKHLMGQRLDRHEYREKIS